MNPICPLVDRTGKTLLAVIAVCLAVIAFRPFSVPATVRAQEEPPRFYIEPGVLMLRQPGGERQVYGKMMVDLRTGDIWGLPTGIKSPYPIDTTSKEPPVSQPFYLGRFDLSVLK